MLVWRRWMQKVAIYRRKRGQGGRPLVVPILAALSPLLSLLNSHAK